MPKFCQATSDDGPASFRYRLNETAEAVELIPPALYQPRENAEEDEA